VKRLVVGAAAGIAVVTVASRVVGFGRIGVLSRTLGTSCVGDTYAAANAIPNVVFEVVAGGALASVVVPVLAGAVAAGDRETAGRTASALLTWTVAVLTPVALLGILLSPYLLRALVGSSPECGRPMLDVGGRMLVVFLPQVVLYGVGIVVAGVLQAHRRFQGPALAPLLSSQVVITA
jgi:putative peptidoglycan lipid II flippase